MIPNYIQSGLRQSALQFCGLLILILILCKPENGQTQEPYSHAWSLKTLFVQLPEGASPWNAAERVQILRAVTNPSESHRTVEGMYIPGDSLFYCQPVEFNRKEWNTVPTSYTFYLTQTGEFGETSFFMKLYTTGSDTILICLSTVPDAIKTETDTTKKKPWTQYPQHYKVYTFQSPNTLHDLNAPEFHPTDYALTSADSTLMEQMLDEGTLTAGLAVLETGLHYFCHDHTLNFGPVEPGPQANYILKFESDFKTKEGPLGIFITKDGIQIRH
jgi:hypothetical protein